MITGLQKHIRFDWAIKRLLRDKANFDVLEGFLSELLMQDIFILEIIESETNKTHPSDKFNRADILVKNNYGELLLIEVQNEKEDDYFHRMNFGQAKLITEQLTQGKTYGTLKKVISINIVYFELGQGTDYIYIGRTEFRGMHNYDILQLNEKQKEIYPIKNVSDVFTVYYLLKVNNFDDVAKTTLDEWIYFLKNSEIRDDFKAKGLAQAKEKLRIDNLDKEDKEEYENYIKIERIRESEIRTAHSDGYFKARQELTPQIEEARGREEEAKKREEEAKKREEEERKQKEEAQKVIRLLALQLKEMGLSIEEIAKRTNLDKKVIENL